MTLNIEMEKSFWMCYQSVFTIFTQFTFVCLQEHRPKPPIYRHYANLSLSAHTAALDAALFLIHIVYLPVNSVNQKDACLSVLETLCEPEKYFLYHC